VLFDANGELEESNGVRRGGGSMFAKVRQ
jgi:hypothetical protein